MTVPRQGRLPTRHEMDDDQAFALSLSRLSLFSSEGNMAQKETEDTRGDSQHRRGHPRPCRVGLLVGRDRSTSLF